MFYTRIPCPKFTNHNPEYINKATRYFPLIGWIVGIISYLAYLLSAYLFTPSIAIVISLIAGILTTGAFHEDGLADVVDGFGGGWTKTKILDIMKDSRVGAFGAIAVILILLLKYTALHSVLTTYNDYRLIPLVFINYHALARLTALNLIFTSQYSREDATSKIKPIAKTYGISEIIGAYTFGLIPLIALVTIKITFMWTLLPLIFVYLYSKRYFKNG